MQDKEAQITKIQNLLESNDTENINLAFQLMEGLKLEKEVWELYGKIGKDYISFTVNSMIVHKDNDYLYTTLFNNLLLKVLDKYFIPKYFHNSRDNFLYAVFALIDHFKANYHQLFDFSFFTKFKTKVWNITVEFIGNIEGITVTKDIIDKINQVPNTINDFRKVRRFMRELRKPTNDNGVLGNIYKYSHLFLEQLWHLKSKNNPNQKLIDYEIIPHNE